MGIDKTRLCLLVTKILGKCFSRRLLSHVCIRSTRENAHYRFACKYVIAISISVCDIGPREIRRFNIRPCGGAIILYGCRIGGRRLFSHIEHHALSSTAFPLLEARIRFFSHACPSFTFIARNFRSIRNKFHFT